MSNRASWQSEGSAEAREPHPGWADSISEEEWRVYQLAIAALRKAEVDFLVGGAFGLGAYIGRLRDTKDIDLYTLPGRVPAAMEALTQAGFEDYYARLPYDRGWIYRSFREGFIVDIIFKMANRRSNVDAIWFQRAAPLIIRGEAFQVVPVEELLWQKIYVLQRDRCDWPDVLNLLDAAIEDLDWDHLFGRLGPDLPLLRGIMQLFEWLCPDRCNALPGPVRDRLRLAEIEPALDAQTRRHRAALLDTRDWFVPALRPERALEL